MSETTAPEEVFDSENVRIEKMFWLPGALGCGTPSDEFCEFIEEASDDMAPLVLKSLPELGRAIEGAAAEGYSDRETAEEVAGILLRNRRRGFLLYVSTPVTINHKPGSYTFSWGYTHNAWLYADAIEDVAPTCAAWAAESLAGDKRTASPSTEEGGQ